MTSIPARVAAVVLAAGAGLGVAVALTWSVGTNSYNVWGAVVVVPIVIAINVVLIRRVHVDEGETWLRGMLGFAFALKVVGALARYYVAYVVYNGIADAQRYNLYAASAYRQWRTGTVTWEWGGKQGTQYMELITTALYTLIGPSPLAAFIVFSSFAFWGQYFLYRAFKVALPDGERRRYAALVLLLPSMLYWPSSIGKESWLMFFVGVTALGAALFFARRPKALLLLVVGGAGLALLRPHLAVLLFGALFVAQLFRPAEAKSTGILTKGIGVLIMGVAAYVLTTQSATFLGIDDFSWQAVSESVSYAGDQASQGGSAFTPVPIGSVLGVPAAVITVLVRPFPFEAHNIQMLVQSLEGLLLFGLLVAARSRVRRVFSIMRTTPYVTFAMVYVAGFVWAFSGFGNFGILARQRVLMIPFFLVLLALPSVQRLREREESEDRELHGARR